MKEQVLWVLAFVFSVAVVGGGVIIVEWVLDGCKRKNKSNH